MRFSLFVCVFQLAVTLTVFPYPNIYRNKRGLSLAQFLYNRLSPQVSSPSSLSSPPTPPPPPSPPPVPRTQYLYQQPTNVNENVIGNQISNSSNGLFQFPLQFLGSFVDLKSSILSDIISKPSIAFKNGNEHIPGFLNDLIEIKKNKIKILKAKHPIPRTNYKNKFVHGSFKPSFKDNFRDIVEYKSSFHQKENIEAQQEQNFKVPTETTPIDLAVAISPHLINLRNEQSKVVSIENTKQRQNYQETTPDIIKVNGKLKIPEETTPIDNVVSPMDLKFGGWKQMQHAESNHVNRIKGKLVASELVESRQQTSATHIAEGPKDKMGNIDFTHAKPKRLENPYAQAQYEENILMKEPQKNEKDNKESVVAEADKDDHLMNLENIFLGSNDLEVQQINLIIKEDIPESTELTLSSVVNIATEANNLLIRDLSENESITEADTQGKVGTEEPGLYYLSDGIITEGQNKNKDRSTNQV